MMELLEIIVLGIGGATIGAVVGFLLYMFCREIRHMRRVAKDYNRLVEKADYWSGSNLLLNMDMEIKKDRDRCYNVERRVDSLEYRSLEHMDTFKHTKRVVRKVRAKK